jgi:hypothetical protein
MRDLEKALADIGDIRASLAAGTLFRGFGPPVMAVTGLLAIATAFLQARVPPSDAGGFVGGWLTVAVISSVLIGVEMVVRTRRHHGGLADAMLFKAVEHFLPVGAAGAAISAIVLSYAADVAWVLPGLWQILLGIGLFVAMRFLPGTIVIASGWYFLTGVVVLTLACQARTLSPWAMGVPFGVGQLLIAAILHVAEEDSRGQD